MFEQRHFNAMVELIKTIREESPDNKQGQTIVEVKALEDYLSLMFAKDNPKFNLTKWRKALGRTDY